MFYSLKLFRDTDAFNDRKKERKLTIKYGHWLSIFELRIINFLTIGNLVSSFNTEIIEKICKRWLKFIGKWQKRTFTNIKQVIFMEGKEYVS